MRRRKKTSVIVKNNGAEYGKKGMPVVVLDHDFPIKELGKAAPYGIYDIMKNAGFVNVGIRGNTAEFAVQSIRKWRYEAGGALEYPKANAYTSPPIPGEATGCA
jgi:hypothetical protein